MVNMVQDYGSMDVKSGDSKFLKLNPGDNRVRICSMPAEVRYVQTSKKGEKYATKYIESDEQAKEEQAKGKQIKYKYAYIVISRVDGKVYVMEIAASVMRQIYTYATNKEYGDPQNYDITVKKEGDGLQTKYTVIPSPKQSPITDEEKKLIKESGYDFSTIYTQEQ